jgi:hypothetical protein
MELQVELRMAQVYHNVIMQFTRGIQQDLLVHTIIFTRLCDTRWTDCA